MTLTPDCVCWVARSCLPLCDPMDCSPPVSSVCGNSPGNNTGVGCHVLLQGIFRTQGLNPGLLHCRKILYRLSHHGSLRVLEWVVYPFSRGSSRTRNWTGVSCIAGEFFTNWATREAQLLITPPPTNQEECWQADLHPTTLLPVFKNLFLKVIKEFVSSEH